MPVTHYPTPITQLDLGYRKPQADRYVTLKYKIVLNSYKLTLIGR